jgi:flagellar hook-basal body complex protein FliE
MIALEKARISLQFAVEARNRVVEAYQEFMRMQI